MRENISLERVEKVLATLKAMTEVNVIDELPATNFAFERLQPGIVD